MIELAGIALARGVAVGAAVTIRPTQSAASRCESAYGARERLAEARHAAQLELTRSLDALPEGHPRQILRAHLALVGDPMLIAEIESCIESGHGAEDALDRAASSLATRFEALGDPALRARSADVRDVCACIARHLTGRALSPANVESRIVCAAELSPGQVLQLVGRLPLAFVLETSVETSHAAILLRSLAVPAVIGVPQVTALVRDGDLLLVDGTRGHIVVRPEPASVRAIDVTQPAAAADNDPEPVRTTDGVAVAVTASIVDAADARQALAAGADGIGLFRTEWLFLRNDALPSEPVQYEAYRAVALLAGDRTVTVRTIDLGGDKQPPALRLPREPNPALGVRGMRLALAHPELLKTQFRALLRAFAGRRLRLLLPMVNDPDEVARTRELLDDAAVGGGSARLDLGVMIETPAAALMADELAAVVDFLSVGTNDLTQYVLAADRESEWTRALYQPLHPAVLRLVRHAIAAAIRADRPVAVCGEAAADPILAPLLVGMGVRELSVPPTAVARMKRVIRRISADAARALGEELVALPTATAIASRLKTLRDEDTDRDVRASGDAR